MLYKEAFQVLGLEEGISFEIVKSTYKQLALKTHPDKNPDDLEATARFQRLGEAYRVLQKHFEPRASHPSRYYHGESGDDDDYFDDDSDYDDDDIYFDIDAEREFFSFLFPFVFSGMRYNHGSHLFERYHTFRPSEKPESQEEFQARLARQREEQEAARVRREQEDAKSKARVKADREREQKLAEKRQEAKRKNKKAAATNQKKHARDVLRSKQRESQVLRSQVFAAARANDVATVKRGIWEQGVDASGGEIKVGCEEFIQSPVADKQETLLHIAAMNGDTELVKWLDAHNAEIDERTSQGWTAFHIAVARGYIPIMQYFLESYPSNDSDYEALYRPPEGTSVLLLALRSRNPDVARVVHGSGLTHRAEIVEALERIVAEDDATQMGVCEVLAKLEGLEISRQPSSHAAEAKHAPPESGDRPHSPQPQSGPNPSLPNTGRS
ncbi:hypothetical protein ONZ45_g3589 [Pleurotus djamor]|nr:hypothetical protein ONZ45_g3589 [Pleurotus djamor]